MLRQQVNLYRYFQAPPVAASFLTWKRFCQLNLFMFCFFVLSYFFSVWENYYLTNKKISLEQNIKILQEKFIAVKSTYPELFFSQDVSESVNKLKKELETQTRIISILVKRQPFSNDLIAFAKAIVPNVWLSRITIDKNGDEITLDGKSTNMKTLQLFLENLLNNKTFDGYVINIRQVENAAKGDKENNVTFEIGITKKSDEKTN